jgi:hypothetical protein
MEPQYIAYRRIMRAATLLSRSACGLACKPQPVINQPIMLLHLRADESSFLRLLFVGRKIQPTGKAADATF